MRTFTTVQRVLVTVALAGNCSWARWMAFFLSQIDSAVIDPAWAAGARARARAAVAGSAVSQARTAGWRIGMGWMLLCLTPLAADGQGAIWKQPLWRMDR